MDEFIDHFFSSSSWSDTSQKEVIFGQHWVSSNEWDTSDSVEPHEFNEKSSTSSLMSFSCMIQNPNSSQGSTLFIDGGDSHSAVKEALLPSGARLQQEGSNHSNPLELGDSTMRSGCLDLQLNSSSLSLDTLNYHSKLLPDLGGLADSTCAPPSFSVKINVDKPSDFQESRRYAQYHPSVPQSGHPQSYVGFPSQSAVTGKGKLQNIGLQGELIEGDATVPGNIFVAADKILQIDNFSAPVFLNGQDELNKNVLSSLAAGPNPELVATADLQSQMGLSQMNEGKHNTTHAPISQPQPELSTVDGGCNGARKPRVRARRGQATDPHSIAERLRREKIAERMKNLQEVVPNSNKTDKASMLDEIVDYVKFLQLQVKVLSMSRLGGAGTGAPLIVESQTEGSICDSSVLPTPNCQEAIHSEPGKDDGIEKEVTRLIMEPNVTEAMRYLQSKGLCLMPIALASSISGCWKPPSFG